MSQASAQAFLDQIGRDPALRTALLALSPGGAGNVTASAEQLVKLAGQWGFDFNQQDIADACAARARRDEGELDDGALSGVAGGTSPDAISAARFSISIDGHSFRFSLGLSTASS